MADLCFLDSETRSESDVTVAGAYKYAHHASTEGIVWGFAFDSAPCAAWSPPWAWHGRSDAIAPLLDHAAAGGYLVAWNAYFDRWIWNAVMVPKYGWPETRPDQWLCAQAQAEANNLPGQLAKACDALRTGHKKDPKGATLIKQLCNGSRDDWNGEFNEAPERMGHFRAYCARDVEAMRDVWQACRPLTLDEWAEYHASEAINDRGVAVDIQFARHARNYAEHEFADINGQLRELTSEPKISLNHHAMKAAWLHEALRVDQELQTLVERPEKDGKKRYSCDRPTREAVLEAIVQPEHAERFPVEHADQIVQFLELIEAGNSAAVRKFTAIVRQETSGRVFGGYSFNGAGQTGRFSSRGIQVHNIIRAPVKKGEPDRAIDAMEMVIAGATPDALRDEFGYPVSRLLARLIRPTFIAPPGKLLTWGDWDQIEGRVLPWLANSPQAEEKLDIYRSGQDVYSITAAQIADIQVSEVTDIQRQSIGKVPELALGFGGSVGALSAMSRSYGVSIPDADKKPIVERWRAQNPWAARFWDQLWRAAIAAFNRPHTWYDAGRVRYYFHPDLMYGTLICELPGGRWLVYPQFEHYPYEYEDPDTGKKWMRFHTSFAKGFGSGHGRVDLWYGVLAENITQAVAASILRAVLRTCETALLPVVLHTHDEIVIESDEKYADRHARILSDLMTRLPEWATGLPLTASLECGPYYTK